MKEIDFLPQRYKNSRRRQFTYHTQYVALTGIFVVMVVWNFMAARSVSRAGAELTQRQARHAEAESVSAELAAVKSELASLQNKVRFVEEIDSKINVASILAEMSFLINEKISLTKIQLIAEKFTNEKQAKPNIASAVKVAGLKVGDSEALLTGNVQFKVVASGIAANTSDVATLVCKLEDSPYFCDVIPLFIRSRQIERGTNPAERAKSCEKDVSKSPVPPVQAPQVQAADIFRVSEFEINCYLANYREQ